MLFILGLVAIVVFTIQVFKTASGTGRNGALWALLTAAIGVAFQFVIPMVIGIIMGIYFVMTGGDPDNFQAAIGGWAVLIGIVSLILSIVGMWLVMRHVSNVPDDPVGRYQTPPPPTF